MSGRTKAQEMVRHVDGMSIADLVEFVGKKEEAAIFLQEFRAIKNEYLETVQAHAKLDQIEGLLKQAKEDRGSAAAELEAARKECAAVTRHANSKMKEASAALNEAEQQARKILDDAKAEAAKTAQRARNDLKAADRAKSTAAKEKDQAAKERKAIGDIKREFQDKRERVQSLIDALNG